MGGTKHGCRSLFPSWETICSFIVRKLACRGGTDTHWRRGQCSAETRARRARTSLCYFNHDQREKRGAEFCGSEKSRCPAGCLLKAMLGVTSPGFPRTAPMTAYRDFNFLCIWETTGSSCWDVRWVLVGVARGPPAPEPPFSRSRLRKGTSSKKNWSTRMNLPGGGGAGLLREKITGARGMTLRKRSIDRPESTSLVVVVVPGVAGRGEG